MSNQVKEIDHKNIPDHGTYSRKHAEIWEFANVTGNGELGAMHFGQPNHEKVIVNHAELFLPLGSKEEIPNMAPYLEDVRKMSKTDGYTASHTFFIEKGKELGHEIVSTDPFHPGFFLAIEQPKQENIADYYRSVDFASGEISSSWYEGNQNFKRKLFASRADQAIIMSLTSNEEMPIIGFSVDRIDHPLMDVSYKVENNMIKLIHRYKHGEGGYESFVKITSKTGTMTTDQLNLLVTNSEEIIVTMKIIPFSDANQLTTTNELEALFSADESYETLVRKHKEIHGELYNRVSVDFGGGEKRKWSSDRLIEEVKETQQLSSALVEKMFQAGRYMFISSSGLRPPNLQGIWTGTWTPSWSSDYTLDTNLQLAMASVFSGNMLEGFKPYVDLLENYIADFKYSAEKMFGCRGILAGIRASNSGKHLHWGDSSWGERECDTFFGAFWTCGAGWLAHLLYDHYLYTGDQAFLRDHAVPFMKEVALFYEDFLYLDENGDFVFNPSYSAENGIAANSTQDIAVAKELLTNLISSCLELKIEHDQISKWEDMLEKLPPYLVNEEGALKEWAVWDHEENYNHRHYAHFYSLFQSYEFSKEETPEMWEASEVALQKKLEHWLYNPNTDTSTHGRMHAGLSAARLGMGETVWDILKMMASGGAIYPSLMTAHYDDYKVFNVDGNGSIPELIHNLLLFSLPGQLNIFPALPKGLPNGKVTGTLCRGQIYVDCLAWNVESKKQLELTITSSKDQTIHVSIGMGEWELITCEHAVRDDDGWKIALKREESMTLKWV